MIHNVELLQVLSCNSKLILVILFDYMDCIDILIIFHVQHVEWGSLTTLECSVEMNRAIGSDVFIGTAV